MEFVSATLAMRDININLRHMIQVAPISAQSEPFLPVDQDLVWPEGSDGGSN